VTTPDRIPLPRLHAITDERVARLPSLDATARALAAAGPVALHARGHSLSGREHYELARRLAAASPHHLFVNDRGDVALAAGAAGVQLSADGLAPGEARRLNAGWWIGASVHDLDAARSARDGGADYLLIGPVFATPTHPEAPPLGVAGLAPYLALGIPVVAIGGIDASNAGALRKAGVWGVAAIRALWDAPDPALAARTLMKEME